MASGSLRRFDVQAKISLIVSLVAALGVVALAVLIVRNFDTDLRVIRFGKQSPYQPIVMATAAATMLLATVGLSFGLSSAGQRRNDRQAQSWIGFFLGTGALSACIILFAMFYMYRMTL